MSLIARPPLSGNKEGVVKTSSNSSTLNPVSCAISFFAKSYSFLASATSGNGVSFVNTISLGRRFVSRGTVPFCKCFITESNKSLRLKSFGTQSGKVDFIPDHSRVIGSCILLPASAIFNWSITQDCISVAIFCTSLKFSPLKTPPVILGARPNVPWSYISPLPKILSA